MLSDDAKKRLLAIVENTHLGAGFEIALRDLEIRGAGEILGIRQSGRAKETGISLYLKLLENKVEELQTGIRSESTEIQIDLDLDIVIAEEFFGNDQDKIQFYRSLESMRTIEELDEAIESFRTFHELDIRIETFFTLMRAKVYLSKYKVRSIKKVLKDYVFEFKNTTTDDIRAFLELDRSGDFLVQSLERVKVARSLYHSDLDFLTKLVYSCTDEEAPYPLSR